MTFKRVLAGAVAALALCPALANAAPDPALGKDVLMRSIAFRTVEGGGQVPALAAYYASVLKAAGFADADIVITPMEGTATFAATIPGSDPSLRPLLMLGHMDVVEAKREDWTRDPFVPVEENGYIFGRGSEDNKYDVAMMVTVLAGLKKDGWKPRRTVKLLLSGDEETAMRTTRALAAQYKEAELALNGDGGGGLLGEDGAPVLYLLQAGEKTYADFDIAFTDPGGHSSAPTATNPLYRLAKAIDRIADYEFAPMINELTRASLTLTAQRIGGEAGEAMRRYVATQDKDAAALLSTYPEFVGQIRTTCVATMAQAGHALNALPQSARAQVNCRIFPGVAIDAVKAELTRIVADPTAAITQVGDATASDASPLRRDVTSAVEAAVRARFPGLSVTPSMSAGATDSLYFRALGVPSYGVSTLFTKASDGFAHGLNERVPAGGIAASQRQWEAMLKALAK
ncbi:acetylornithine deacetylase/succinyl-diaminopimelate desuccinylase-like protein [Sphingobium fontiphilum]|uniref:Acetylornithine deacetylase/succinyl-diaminopimelate desuccinylase-like protein n=1 Tax=Sphingobium fontiphilum TaxID=944425 RepID=A0A7W6DJC6_9SPHN|nr:M20/M25/M40 family metallo-hydrolase [Sphingobium fontiphilum]MBB3981642.1 acetylornithine deacetylase/succinyl-diaminopimelate desuccinylase-like protein [Sphingobium fontiphilum]